MKYVENETGNFKKMICGIRYDIQKESSQPRTGAKETSLNCWLYLRDEGLKRNCKKINQNYTAERTKG